MIKKSVLLTALAIAGFAVTSLAQTVPNYVPTNGLVGWWPFNGNAIDESANTNDGTVNGATLTTDRFGNANKAYSFNGNSNEILIPHNNSLNALPISISVWFRTSNQQQDKMLVNKYGCQTYNGYSFNINNNKPSAYYYSNGSQNNVLNLDPLSINNLTLNDFQWHHGLLIIEADSSKIYIDNYQVINVPTSSGQLTLTNTVEDLHFAKYAYGNCGGIGQNYFYNGELDDIGIWNRALTPNEITGLYNANLCFQTITVTDTLLINTNLTGFNPVTYQNTIKIWPNPTNDHITIDNGNLANLTGHQIKISNALGQQVFQSAITQQQFYVNMSTWGGNGIYFVNLINAQGVTIETRKIVLQ